MYQALMEGDSGYEEEVDELVLDELFIDKIECDAVLEKNDNKGKRKK